MRERSGSGPGPARVHAARGPLAAARVQGCGPAPPSALHRARRSWRCSPGPGRRRAERPGPPPHRGPRRGPENGRGEARAPRPSPASVRRPSQPRTTQPGPGRRCNRPPAARPAQRPAPTRQRRPEALRLGGKGGRDERLPRPPPLPSGRLRLAWG